MAKHMSASERHDHYRKHNHRVHHDHSRGAAAKMDTRKMQVGRHTGMKGLHA